MGRGNHLGESGRHYESAAPAVVSPFQIARLASRPVRPHTGLMPTYTMSRQVVVVLYVMAMVDIIVALDFVFFRKILGTAYGEQWHCLGVRDLLLQVPKAFLIAN